MKEQDILGLTAMPMASPSYPKGPYRFIHREYMIVTYESDPAAIRAALPEPLEPDGSNHVMFECLRMPDSSGFGDYTESGIVIPAKFNGVEVNFTSQMYLDDEPPITGGREIWGFPKKFGQPKLEVIHDTLTATVKYADTLVAVGTMKYKNQDLTYDLEHQKACDPAEILKKLTKTQVNLKLIPDVDGSLAIAQLVAYNMCDATVRGAWSSPARLQLHEHVNAPMADLPCLKAVIGSHFIADITLPYGYVLYDYKTRTSPPRKDKQAEVADKTRKAAAP